MQVLELSNLGGISVLFCQLFNMKQKFQIKKTWESLTLLSSEMATSTLNGPSCCLTDPDRKDSYSHCREGKNPNQSKNRSKTEKTRKHTKQKQTSKTKRKTKTKNLKNKNKESSKNKNCLPNHCLRIPWSV